MLMKRAFLLLTIFSLLIPSVCAAQKDKEKSKLDGKGSVNAHIIDGSTTENMPQVTVQLFELPDTTFIYGTVTDNEGWFNIKKVPVGEFLLRYSFMGYSTQEFSFKTV